MKNSKQLCTEHAQATLPKDRINQEKLSLTAIASMCNNTNNDHEEIWRYCNTRLEEIAFIGHTPTLGDWLEVMEMGGDYDCRCKIEDGVMKLFSSSPIITFNLTTGEPDNWDTLAELLGL